MKLNRKQELYLIDLGWKAVLDRLIPDVKPKVKKEEPEIKSSGLTDAAKKRISKRMKAYWRKRKAAQ